MKTPMKMDILPLDQMLGEQARRFSRKTLVKFEGKKYSYQEMDRLASMFAAYLLERGLRRGDGFQENRMRHVRSFVARVRAGRR